MPYKDPNRRKQYMKAWKEANKESEKAKNKAWYAEHRESEKAKNKAWYAEHRESEKAKAKAWQEANKEHYRDYRKHYQKDYYKYDLNANGQTKHSIRCKSQRILKQMNLNIQGYEIHHCFGYEDPSKFIYISKELHLKIHQLLRDKNIDASCDHWMHIRELVNSTDEFVYIKA